MDKNSRARGRIITRKARTRTGTTGRTGMGTQTGTRIGE